MSTPARLFDQYGRSMSVTKGASTARVGGFLSAGSDENGIARTRLVESKFRATVRAPLGTYASRFSPENNGIIGYSRPATETPASFGSSNNRFVTVGGSRVSLPALYAVSTSANDSTGGTGAQQLTLIYWSIDGKRNVSQVAMNGITPVAITCAPNVFFIDQFFITAAGNSGAAAGTITISDDALGTNVQVTIGIGGTRINQALIASNNAVYVTAATMEASASAFDIKVMNLSVAQFNYRTTNIDQIQTRGIQFTSSLGGFLGFSNKFNPPILINKPDVDCMNFITPSTGNGTIFSFLLEPFL